MSDKLKLERFDIEKGWMDCEHKLAKHGVLTHPALEAAYYQGVTDVHKYYTAILKEQNAITGAVLDKLMEMKS